MTTRAIGASLVAFKAPIAAHAPALFIIQQSQERWFTAFLLNHVEQLACSPRQNRVEPTVQLGQHSPASLRMTALLNRNPLPSGSGFFVS
jgi:hypothetical protein